LGNIPIGIRTLDFANKLLESYPQLAIAQQCRIFCWLNNFV
jgi:hypothetical protein